MCIVDKSLMGFISLGLGMMQEIEEEKDRYKERIRKEWTESIKLPRKSKKKKRKELLLDWAIANWDMMASLK